MAAMMLIREKDRVPLISSGHDWARHFQLIEAALKLRQRHFMFDGEAVVLGPNGVSDFAALHSGKHNAQAQLHSFDMLAAGGADHRQLTLSLRKANLDRLLSRPVDGISMAHYEQASSVLIYSVRRAA